LRSQRKSFLVKRVGGIVWGDIEGNLGDNRAVIRERIDLKKGDSGGGFTIDDLPGTGSRASVFGEG